MFARVKKSGKYQYLQIVENRREGPKTIQRVIATIGRMDKLHARGSIETLVRSLSRFSEKVLLIVSNKSQLKDLLSARKFEFDVERAIFLTVLHRLFTSGSDRCCDKWHRDYLIEGVDTLSLHHLYRGMAFLGEEVEDQKNRTPFSPRCTKDLIEEDMFFANRNLFTGLDLVFFDTTSIYFEGQGVSPIEGLGLVRC